ncbi:MAG: nucleotidyltransferase [Gemmatimonadetes bacterium]|nr:nucleotidyltransferase [Gemmatimonadota bacterium]
MIFLSEASREIDRQIQLLDLPSELSKEAVAEYGRIARWLGAVDSPLAEYKLDLYPQGSFRLGTPIRPITHEDEFDIDLVCQLKIEKERTTQADLKELVGARLSEDPNAWGKLKERRRCWTIFYEKKFHLDVLPTIPDAEHRDTGILVTDTDLVRWQFSNPLGYSRWFYERMHTFVREERAALAKSLEVDIEDVPEWGVRTPLQRAVQVLKRHRDVHFSGDLERRPASIILTTLAGRAYGGEPDLSRALVQIIEGMGDHIDDRDGQWWIPNPAHVKENFADKWNEKPALRDAFLRWRDKVYEDMEALASTSSHRDAALLLEKSLHGRRALATTSVASAHLPGGIPEVDSLVHRQTPPWPIMERYECSVSARSSLPSGGGRWRYLAVPRAPKNTTLEFQARTNAPLPYEIFWQITNTGAEAREAGQMRGGFDRGSAPRGESRTETTRYNGTHLVQAFVVKDGDLVARSREVRVRIEKR